VNWRSGRCTSCTRLQGQPVQIKSEKYHDLRQRCSQCLNIQHYCTDEETACKITCVRFASKHTHTHACSQLYDLSRSITLEQLSKTLKRSLSSTALPWQEYRVAVCCPQVVVEREGDVENQALRWDEAGPSSSWTPAGWRSRKEEHKHDEPSTLIPSHFNQRRSKSVS
jgi:hypothetical protein